MSLLGGPRGLEANCVMNSAETNSTYDQIPIRAILFRQDEVQQEQLVSISFRREMHIVEVVLMYDASIICTKVFGRLRAWRETLLPFNDTFSVLHYT